MSRIAFCKRDIFMTTIPENISASNLPEKIVSGLERISEVFKTLLWDKAKIYGISPMQIQILLFVHNHQSDLCNVSQLAKEFDVTKPTISDAVRVLEKKELVIKDFSLSDNRSFTILLSAKGKNLIRELSGYATVVSEKLNDFDRDKLSAMYATLAKLIYQLNRSGILSVQRTCFGCKFYERNDEGHYCNYLKTKLLDKDIRIDCPEFEER